MQLRFECSGTISFLIQFQIANSVNDPNQIGNTPSNLCIIDYSHGMTGSAHDAAAFANTAAGRFPDWLFNSNKFAWADSAYTLNAQTVPVHKKPASLLRHNALFDKAVSHIRVHSEHTMGALKGRWQCLHDL